MGWKICLTLVKDSPYSSVSQLAKAIGVLTTPQTIELDRAFYPAEDLSIGIFQGTAIISYDKIAESVIDTDGTSAWEGRLRQAFPEQEMMVAILHSVVNLAGYALFRKGKRLRRFCCSADDGIFRDEGERWQAEAKVFDRSHFNSDGLLVIDDGDEEMPLDCYGEELVFDLSQQILGFRLDNGPDGFYQLPMTVCTTNAPWWKRLFSRG